MYPSVCRSARAIANPSTSKHDEALASHEQARKLAPKEIRVLVNLAKAQLAKNTEESVKAAVQYFKATLKLDPGE